MKRDRAVDAFHPAPARFRRQRGGTIIATRMECCTLRLARILFIGTVLSPFKGKVMRLGRAGRLADGQRGCPPGQGLGREEEGGDLAGSQGHWGAQAASAQRATQPPEPRLLAEGPRKVRASAPALQPLSRCHQDAQLPPASRASSLSSLAPSLSLPPACSVVRLVPAASSKATSEAVSLLGCWTPPSPASCFTSLFSVFTRTPLGIQDQGLV